MSDDATLGEAPVARLRHRAPNRWMHWINVPLMTIMLWSGLRIYWADDTYAFGIGSWEWFHFFPEGLYEFLQLNQRLARGIAFHLTFGWLFVANGAAYVAYLLATGRVRDLVPTRSDWRRLGRTVLADLGVGEREAADRYNPAQKAAYTVILLMGAVLVASGFAIYKPTSLSWLTAMFFGYENARFVHFSVSMLFVAFVVVHLVQVLRAGWRPLAAMVTGYERLAGPSAAPAAPGNEDRTADAPTTGAPTTGAVEPTSARPVVPRGTDGAEDDA